MRTLPDLSSLTPDERVWRLDWFGECAYPGSVRRYAQPSIKVVISPLLNEIDDIEVLFQPGGTDHARQREVWVPISALPMLGIGDLWRDGRRVVSPTYQVETFQNVRIEPGTTSFVKAGLAVDGHFLIPLHAHPWHRLHTQAYCVAVSLENGRRLLIPCVEIIRFYFGSSSNLLQRLFRAPLTTEALWSSKRFDSATRHLHLVLADWLSGASASDIGRIAGSRFAWRSAAGIHASCQKATASGHPAYPYTGFPFEGSTEVSVRGVWLPFGDEPASTFLVYQLQACTHPFPFRSLSYDTPWRDDRTDRSRNQDGAQATTRRAGEISERTKTTDIDPSARKSQRSGVFTVKSRFPDLLRKQVWQDKVDDFKNTDVFVLRSDGSIEQVAFGEPDGSSDVAGFDVVVQSEKGAQYFKEPPLPHFVRKAIAQIRREIATEGDNDTRVQTLCPKNRPSSVFALPVVLDERGVAVSDLVFTDEAGETRQRRGCFVEVVGSKRTSQILAIVEEKDVSSAAVVITVDDQDVANLIRRLLP